MAVWGAAVTFALLCAFRIVTEGGEWNVQDRGTWPERVAVYASGRHERGGGCNACESGGGGGGGGGAADITAEPAVAEEYLLAGNLLERKHVDLVPIMRPQQNMRDVVTNMALLETHLFNAAKNCHDCIRKHFILIQGYLEEALSLVSADPAKALPVPLDIQRLEQTVRSMHLEWEESDRSPPVRQSIAQRMRQLRKGLMADFAKPLRSYALMWSGTHPSYVDDRTSNVLVHDRSVWSTNSRGGTLASASLASVNVPTTVPMPSSSNTTKRKPCTSSP
ncbi:hypothetical protein JKP88DRAFT_273069 [Tribonema minus]|uniref:Uncharacterized protein n=1 Tax=Tribonema minus TaxID=303371 RepID=A0A835Z4Q8_9STRA|nr:hypothetical protein JKP88DRAFT_273069 [Tribonema minus]